MITVVFKESYKTLNRVESFTAFLTSGGRESGGREFNGNREFSGNRDGGSRGDFRVAPREGGRGERFASRDGGSRDGGSRERFGSRDGAAPRPGSGREGMVRLFLNLGRKDNVAPNHIVGAITSEAKIPGRVIGQIDIYDKFSFVEVPQNDVNAVLRAMNGNTINGREASLEVAK